MVSIVDLTDVESVKTGGVTFTADKSTGTITATGTPVRNLVIRVKENITGYDKLLLKGGATGGAGNTYFYALYDNTEPPSVRVAYVTDADSEVVYSADASHSYYVAVVVMKDVAVDGIVFAPRLFAYGEIVGGMIDAIDDVTASLNKIKTKYRYLDGLVFICECGTHVYVDAVSFRLYDKENKGYTTSVSGTTILKGDVSSPNYIHFDGAEFTRSTAVSENSIAVVYKKIVYPLIDGIIPNYRKIQNGYLRTGSEYYINYARTPIDALGVYNSPSVKISKRGYIYKATGSVVYNVNGTAITFNLAENTADISNKKVLMIGDSFIARGYVQNWLHSLVPTLEFIGTKTTQYYEYRTEGVSGSRLYYFTDPDTSPFYFDGVLDFSKYLINNNLSAPDYVVINSAINHTYYNHATYGTYLSNLLELVNMVKSYDSTIKIYVTYGANYAVNLPSVYGYPNLRFEEVRKCCNSVYDVDGITVIPIDSALIDELDYNETDIDYLGKTVTVLSDCVHPSENVGFRKIANMIYNYLGA